MKNRIPLKDDWYTPPEFLKELEKEFGPMFDPCPLNHDITKWNGLEIEWKNVNFINPPYSRKLKELFIRKAFKESQKGKICVMLLPVSTSTKIFHEIIYPNAELRFIKGRLKFNGLKTAGQMDNMLVIFGNRNIYKEDNINIIMKDKNKRSEDMLKDIFVHQKLLQEKLGVYKKINSDSMHQQYINQNILALFEETVEVMRETAYKNPDYVPFGWKKGQTVNNEKFKEELIDLLHFFMNLCIISGMDPKEIHSRYLNKNKENHKRQEDGY